MIDELTPLWHEKIAKIDPFVGSFESLMLVFFKRQEKEIIQNILSSGIKVPLEVQGVIFDFEKWKRELEKLVEPELRAIIGVFIQAVMDEFAVINEIDMSLPSVRNAIGNRVRDLSRFVNNTTGKEIKELLQKAEEQRLSIQRKADLVRKKFEEISPRRAKLIAQTETMGAANEGTLEGIRQAKIPGKQWITSRDDRVRFDHQIDGQIVPLDLDFTLQNGSQVPYPMAIGERCVLSPHKLDRR